MCMCMCVYMQEFYFKNAWIRKCSRGRGAMKFAKELQLPEEDPAGRKRWYYALGYWWVVDETRKEGRKDRRGGTESMKIPWKRGVRRRYHAKLIAILFSHLITKTPLLLLPCVHMMHDDAWLMIMDSSMECVCSSCGSSKSPWGWIGPEESNFSS